jgi:hypothetical protein
LTNAAGGHRLIDSSSPIIIPKKPIHSNVSSSQSSSSYTSLADQMSSMGETLFQSNRDSDDAEYTSLPLLPSNAQKLEHAAARDRILVKKKRRQPIKEKLTTLRETDDNQTDLFVSKSDDEEEIVETKSSPQSMVDLSNLDTTRSQFRVLVRPRDHSADHVLSPTPVVPTHISSIQRSVSFKRPQEINETKFINRSIYKIEKNKEEQGDENKKSLEEHIYDNLDVFKRNRTNIKPDPISNDRDSTINQPIKTREHSTGRLRPVTTHIPSNNEKQITNEFETVFNQLKRRTSIKNEEIVSVSEEPVQSQPPLPPLPSIVIEETPRKLVTENEPIPPVMTSTSKVTVTSSVLQSPNRRKTVGGVNLPGNNKVAADDNKPTPSWIDIAKQKQSKFQSIANEKDPYEELEQQPTSIEQETASRKPQVTISSNTAIVKENTSEEICSNRKLMYESIITRRASPPITHGIERDSIRALKASNPNRINNLIQLFEK